MPNDNQIELIRVLGNFLCCIPRRQGVSDVWIDLIEYLMIHNHLLFLFLNPFFHQSLKLTVLVLFSFGLFLLFFLLRDLLLHGKLHTLLVLFHKLIY
jgi:hypothetical protein